MISGFGVAPQRLAYSCTKNFGSSFSFLIGDFCMKLVYRRLFCISQVGRKVWHLSFAVGNGMPIRFWIEPRIGDSSFRENFPNLNAIAEDKAAWVVEYVLVSNGRALWQLVFWRQFQIRELEEVIRCLTILEEVGTGLVQWEQ